MEKTSGVANWLKKTLLFIGGIAATHGFSYFYDYVVYPIVTYKLGFWRSLVVLFVIAVLLNYLFIKIYDLFKKDLFGFEALKKMTVDEVKNEWRFMHKVLKWGSIPVFIALSWYDPIFAVIYKRKSHNFDGFTARDYKILILSTAIGCVIWSGAWTGGIALFKLVFLGN